MRQVNHKSTTTTALFKGANRGYVDNSEKWIKRRQWIVALIYVIVCTWWTLLITSFAWNVSTAPLSVRHYFMNVIVGFAPHTGMLLSIIKTGKRFYKTTLFLNTGGIMFYLYHFGFTIKAILLCSLGLIGFLLACINLILKRTNHD
jgi:hypothetical protein